MITRFFRYFSNLLKDHDFIYILKSGGLIFSSQVWTVITNLILNYIVAKVYGANIVGILALITSILNFTAVFGLSGLNIATLKLIPEHQVKFSNASSKGIYKQIFKLVLINTIILSLIVFFNSAYIAKTFFNKPHLELYVKLSALFLVPFTFQMLNESAFKAFKKIKAFVAISIFTNTLKVAFLVLLGYFIASSNLPIYIVLSSFLLLFILGTMYLFHFYKSQKQDVPVKIEKDNYIRMMALPMFLTAASTVLISTTDIFILSYYLKESDVGVYYIVNRLTNLITFMLLAVNSVSAGNFSNYYSSKQFDKLRSSSKSATLVIFAFSLPVTIILIIFGKPILLFFGESFLMGFIALIYISIGKLVNAATGSVGWLLNMTGNQSLYCAIVFIGGVLNILLNFALIPKMGINGAALANMVSMIFINLVSLVYVKKKLGFWNFFI